MTITKHWLLEENLQPPKGIAHADLVPNIPVITAKEHVLKSIQIRWLFNQGPWVLQCKPLLPMLRAVVWQH